MPKSKYQKRVEALDRFRILSFPMWKKERGSDSRPLYEDYVQRRMSERATLEQRTQRGG